MHIALFQPDIPQNTGTILRLCACLGAAAHIIEPAGFPISDRHFRRAGMDYLDHVALTRHDSWSKFEQWRNEAGFRLVLFTTKAADSYLDFSYRRDDVLLFGRESAGVTAEIAAAADARLAIPIRPGLRSLNVAMAAAMALGEALRQTGSAIDGRDAVRGEIVSYAVKEIFLTLQGEGAHAGRAAVFCRFSGCNLWSGREQDRAAATCQFCDTDFVGTDGTLGGRYATADELADTIAGQWTGENTNRYVVLTGGEPLLQVDAPFIDALHARGFAIGIETNGTIEPPGGMDWVCVSPKAGAGLVVRRGHELKLVYPQAGAAPEDFAGLDFERFSLQPMDGPDVIENTARTVDYCLRHPQWRLSLQTHKTLGIR